MKQRTVVNTEKTEYGGAQEAVAIRPGALLSSDRLGRKAQNSFSIYGKLTD